MAWLELWKYRHKITIDHDLVDGTLTDFPVFINISSSSGIGGADLTPIFDELASDANRKKIAITTDDGVTECYVEIERWDDASEVAELWVKVPSISATVDTDLYIYFDSTHTDNTTYIGDTTEAAAQAVWDSNFKAVWHMAQDPNGDPASGIKDSTASAKHGSPEGTMTTADLVSAKVGLGIDFDGDDDDLDLGSIGVADPLRLNGADVTIEAIVNNQSGGDIAQKIIEKSDGGAAANGYCLDLALLKARLIVDGSVWSTTSDVISYNTDYHVAGIITGSTYSMYVNGANKAGGFSQGSAIQPPDDTTNAKIGTWNHSTAREFKGVLDEIRVSSTARTAAWIKATYYSNWDDLNTFGAVEEIELLFEAVTSISMDVVIIIPDVSFDLTTSLSAEVFAGAAIDCVDSFEATTSIETDIIISTDVEFEAVGSLEISPVIIIPDLEFTAVSSLSLEYESFSISDASRVYIFTLTGAADGVADINIPISSFQSRIQSGNPSYLSVVISGLDYLSAINARLNGDLVLRMGYKRGSTILLTEIVAAVDFSNPPDYDEGSDNQSIILSGYRTETYTAKSVTIAGNSYKSMRSGKFRFRCSPDLYLRPGDTVTNGVDSFTVESISFSVSPEQETYEVAE